MIVDKLWCHFKSTFNVFLSVGLYAHGILGCVCMQFHVDVSNNLGAHACTQNLGSHDACIELNVLITIS